MKIFQPHLCEGIMNLLENSSSFKQREKLLHSNYDSATVPEELKYESWLSKKIHMKYIHCQVNILEKQKLKSCFSQSFIFLNLSTFWRCSWNSPASKGAYQTAQRQCRREMQNNLRSWTANKNLLLVLKQKFKCRISSNLTWLTASMHMFIKIFNYGLIQIFIWQA